MKQIPAGLGNLKDTLIRINMQKNDIPSIPQEIFDLRCLEQLYLSGNYIEEFPQEVSKLSSLREIFIDNNEIESIPGSLLTADMPNLQTISLKNNAFETSTLPPEFLHWKETRNLNLDIDFERPDQVMKGVFIGSENSASCKKVLKKLGITHILIVADNITPAHPADFIYKVIEIQDSKKTELERIFFFAPYFFLSLSSIPSSKLKFSHLKNY